MTEQIDAIRFSLAQAATALDIAVSSEHPVERLHDCENRLLQVVDAVRSLMQVDVADPFARKLADVLRQAETQVAAGELEALACIGVRPGDQQALVMVLANGQAALAKLLGWTQVAAKRMIDGRLE